MKKNLLIVIGLLFLFGHHTFAGNRYWVGGSGSWNSASHWSAISGGAAGAMVPTQYDDVIFDENSNENSALTVSIIGSAQCRDLTVLPTLGTTVFVGNVTSIWNIYGALSFSSFVQNSFSGELAFTGTGTKNIDFKNAMPNGNVHFNGSSTWNFNSDLFLSFYSKIIIESGSVNIISHNLQAFGVQWLGTASKSLNISHSKLVLTQTLDESGTGNSSVIKTGAVLHPRYTGVSRSIDSIQTVVVPPLCNTSCDGCVTVTVFSPDAGPFQFDWTGGSCGAGCSGNPLCGLCNGSYLLTVTDLSDGEQLQQFVQVIAPNPIGCNFIRRKPKCFGQCNGSITANVIVGSGTAPYTYSWNTIPVQTTQTAVNLCAGTYILTITDAHGCTQNFTQILTQPAVVAPNVTHTNLSCFGVCNGTANSAPTGGNIPTPYTYSWTGPGGPYSTQNLSSLCAGTYNLTVLDDSLCSGSASVIVTTPPVITLTPSHTNISCFGACNGTATVAPVSGGTPGYTFVWTGSAAGPYTGQGTASLSGLCPGTYTATVTDANGCVKTSNFTITQPPALTVSTVFANVSCFGVCTGTATATPAGGTAGYSYVWTGSTSGPYTGQGTANLTNLCPGTYTVTITDVNGCTATSNGTVNQPTLLVPNPTSTDITCFGLCNGTATAAPTGGTGVYSYVWTGTAPGPYTGQGTSNLINLCPGTYSVTVTDANGCDTMQSVVITQPPLLTVTVIKTNVTCFNACNGTITATTGGGTPPYVFVWTGSAAGPYTGQGTSDLTNLCPGTYTITVTDANGCTATANTTITQPPVFTVNVIPGSLSCNGDCNATAAGTVVGGTAGYTFSWLPFASIGAGQGTSNASSLCAGTYTLNVTDANSCVASDTVAITQPTPLTLVSNTVDIPCFGGNTGSAAVVPGGGSLGYTYLWQSGGQTTSSISGQFAGTYTITVTDANSCTIADTLTINQPNALVANASVVSNVTCNGACNGSATAAPAGGTSPFTYSWTGPGGFSSTSQTITLLCQGIYTATVTDANGCTSSQPVTIIQPAILSVSIGSTTSSCTICNGSATAIPSGGTSAYSYLWSDGQTTATASLLCPNAPDTVVVTDANGCTATTNVTISPVVIISITTSGSNVSCFGSCDGIATANPSGGTAPYIYVWTDPAGDTSATATNLCAGTYTVTVGDAAGCTNSDSITFTNPPILDVTAVKADATCGGVCNGTATATATGGTGAYTYSWLPGGQTTATATALCSGTTYICTVTDANGCTDTVSVIIGGPLSVIDNATITSANCTFADGIISVSPTGGTGGYTYFWSPAPPVGQGTATASGLLPGAYTLIITDAAGCTFTFNYLLNNINGPTLVMAHTNVTCHNACDGTAMVTPSGGIPGYTFNWGPGAPVGGTTNAVTALCGTTTYTVTVTDAIGCITLDTATIINPTFIFPNVTKVNETCGGLCNGSINLAPTGGVGPYTFSWSSGQTTSSISGLCAGPYTYTITDANGCNSSATVTITSPPILMVSLTSTNVTCNGACNGTATAVASGGSGGAFTYLWCHNAALVLPNVVNLCPGMYCVTVGNGTTCTATDTVIITEPPVLTTSTTFTNASCNGICDGVATVAAVGGTAPYTYLWNPTAIVNDTASGLCPGSYIPTVTDANGCTSTPPAVTITEPLVITPNVTFVNPTCNGSCNGTAVANPTGGTGTYSYLWSPGGATTQSVSGLCAGSYTCDVSNSSGAGCTQSQVIVLVDPPVLNANASNTSPTCFNGCNGSVTSNPTGGTGIYTYSWTPGGPFLTQTVNSLCPNTYQVIVTDANGCKDTAATTMVNPSQLNALIGSTPASCGVCDGTMTITPVAGTGTAPYTYLWTPAPGAGQFTPNGTAMCAGLYDITVTDVNGCDSTFTVPMNNSGGVTSTINSTTDVTCSGMCNGIGSVDTIIGGVPPYTFLWNDGPPPTTNDTAINLCAGVYFIGITDSNSCIFFSSMTINEPTPILSNGVVTSAVCSNVCTGAITITPSGGVPGYTYAWLPAAAITAGQGTPSVSGLCPGTYTVDITDANGCVKVDSFVVTQSAPLTATISSTNISCSSVCNGMAYVTITTGTPPFTIQWNDPSGQANDTATALCPGTYTATIKDSLGCIQVLTTTITATPAIVANPTIINATCGACDGSAFVTPTGGTAPYAYVWSGGVPAADTTTNLCAGLYSVNITDAVGCSLSFPIPVSNTGGPTSVTITSTNLTCNGVCTGAVTSTVPAGGVAPYTFLWIAGGQTTSTLAGLCAGTYFVEVTDANECSLLDSVVITEPAPILSNQVVTAATCGACDGSIAVIPSGGTAPYSNIWNTGSVNDTLISLCPGVYNDTITDAAGCSVNIVVPVNSVGGPALTMASTNVTCNAACDGTAIVTATGASSPYVYLWNDPSVSTTPVATPLCPGNYFVTVTGTDGCVSVASATITEPSAITFSAASVTDPLCNGDTTGAITVIPSGGTLMYSYSWNTIPVQNTASAINLGANTYIVTVTDANGCTATQSTTLVQASVLTISDVVTNTSCNTVADGAVDVTVSGGTPVYIYSWSPGGFATEDLSAIFAGSYTITVTDANGCTIKDTADVLPNSTVIAVAGNDTTFCDAGTLTLNAGGSTNGVNFQWFQVTGATNTNVGNTVSVSITPPSGSTTYYVIVDNGTGCSDNDTLIVTSNPLPGANAGPDATIVIGATTPIGGSPTTSSAGAAISWSPIPTLDNGALANPTASPVATTTYTVTVTNASGCTSKDSMIVTVLPTIVIPDGISPNGDGSNDEWIIDGIELFPDCNVEVYNRWGELLFQSTGYKEHWKGTYKGKDLPVGTYYYIVNLNDPKFPDAYTGPITIMR